MVHIPDHVVLLAKGGEKFEINPLALCAASPVFLVMMSTPDAEHPDTTNGLHTPDTDFDAGPFMRSMFCEQSDQPDDTHAPLQPTFHLPEEGSVIKAILDLVAGGDIDDVPSNLVPQVSAALGKYAMSTLVTAFEAGASGQDLPAAHEIVLITSCGKEITADMWLLCGTSSFFREMIGFKAESRIDVAEPAEVWEPLLQIMAGQGVPDMTWKTMKSLLAAVDKYDVAVAIPALLHKSRQLAAALVQAKKESWSTNDCLPLFVGAYFKDSTTIMDCLDGMGSCSPSCLKRSTMRDMGIRAFGSLVKAYDATRPWKDLRVNFMTEYAAWDETNDKS